MGIEEGARLAGPTIPKLNASRFEGTGCANCLSRDAPVGRIDARANWLKTPRFTRCRQSAIHGFNYVSNTLTGIGPTTTGFVTNSENNQ
jgi:hypothetical protein